MTGPRLKVPLLLVAAVVIHTSVLSGIRVQGVRPDLMLLIAACAGLVGGPERGAIVGFASGLASDIFLQTPLGLSALTFTVVAFTVGTIHSSVLRSVFWIPPLTAVLASALGVLLFVLIGVVVGQVQLIQPVHVAIVMAGVAALNAPLSLVAVRAVTWAMEPEAQ